jgi:hypothetical protein
VICGPSGRITRVRYVLPRHKAANWVGRGRGRKSTQPGANGVVELTPPGPIRKILTHLGEPLEPPPISPARRPPTDWGELVQVHDDRDVFQSSSDELPVIDIHSL